RQRFEGKRCPDAPFSTHRNAEERAGNHQEGKRGCKSAGELEDRKADDVKHQGTAAPPALSQSSEDQRSQRPHGQRPEGTFDDNSTLDVKVRGDRRNAEVKDKKIK